MATRQRRSTRNRVGCLESEIPEEVLDREACVLEDSDCEPSAEIAAGVHGHRDSNASFLVHQSEMAALLADRDKPMSAQERHQL